jgi:tetratricopeptide (TPR) repeat protein
MMTYRNVTANEITHTRQIDNPQNVKLIWFNANYNQADSGCQRILEKLRVVIDDVRIFERYEDCEPFLRRFTEHNIFVISSGSLGQKLLPRIHDIASIRAIYIFCQDVERHKEWAHEWWKIKGVHNQIRPIIIALDSETRLVNQDDIAVSFLSEADLTDHFDLDQLQPLFMYTQLFKNTFLGMEYDKNAVSKLLAYCEDRFQDKPMQLGQIRDFAKQYKPSKAIYWYTHDSPIHQMLNKSLRDLEADVMVMMGFYIRDLHQEITRLHCKQTSTHMKETFSVYRGQLLSTEQLNKLRKSKGGLMCFNSFLSTTVRECVALKFARNCSSEKRGFVSVMFMMDIDPKLTTTPFAKIQDKSKWKREAEVLFSMHSIFRIGNIECMDKNDEVYRVRLKLTSDNDQQLYRLMKRFEEEIEGITGWKRIGQLLLRVNAFEKAEEVYKDLLKAASTPYDQAQCYYHLGLVENGKGDCLAALAYYEKAIAIMETALPLSYAELVTLYNSTGLVYKSMGNYCTALSFYDKAVVANQKAVHLNHTDLAISYNNIGLVYMIMKDYKMALSYYEKALDIRQAVLVPNHPMIAISYNNIGSVHMNKKCYPEALSFYKRALAIITRSLPSNHPELATAYNNIGLAYKSMADYNVAISYYEKALAIQQDILVPNHPAFITSYNNMGTVYYGMNDCKMALFYYRKVLDIQDRALSFNQTDLADTYSNVGAVYQKMRNYTRALHYFEQSQQIRQSILGPSHPQTRAIREWIRIAKESL